MLNKIKLIFTEQYKKFIENEVSKEIKEALPPSLVEKAKKLCEK